MTALELLRLAFAGVHDALRADLQSVDEGELFAAPRTGMNHAGFLFWHLVRDEDVVVHEVCGGTTLWESEGWVERAGFAAAEQGTAFAPELAASVRYPVAEFMAYAERVWAATDELLRRESAETLERAIWGDSTAAKVLLDGSLGHNWVHLGEMRYALGLEGWRFSE